jgi:hypothetical protein
MKRIFMVAALLGCVAFVLADDEPTTQPTTQPAEVVPMQSDSEMARMLHTSTTAQPIPPEPAPPPVDATSGMGATKPKAPVILLRPEGYYIIGRLARLGVVHEGFRDLVFDSDGQAMHDPPMRVLPNQIFAAMEDQAKGSSDPMAFRISGLITQYKDRNYILIDKAVQEPRK